MVLKSQQITLSDRMLTENFEYVLFKKCGLTDAIRSISYQLKSTGILLGHSGTHMVHSQRHMPSGKNNYNEPSKLCQKTKDMGWCCDCIYTNSANGKINCGYESNIGLLVSNKRVTFRQAHSMQYLTYTNIVLKTF